MRKVVTFYLLSIFLLVLTGCTLDVLDSGLFDSTIGGVRLSIEVDASDVVSKYSVISASIGIVDSAGKAQYTNWTVASTNQQFTFQTLTPGMTYICLTDRDSLGDTNVFYTNATFSSGHNYKLLVRLGAGTKRFGIYSEFAPLGTIIGLNSSMDWWSGGENTSDDTTTFADGIQSLRIAPTSGGGWWGVGIQVSPTSAYKDMHSYREGSLRFCYRGTKTFKVGIKSGPSVEAWMLPAQLFNYGLKTNDTWCTVIIPFTNFTAVAGFSFTNISHYFMISADSGMGYTPGTVYHIDHIYWCNKTN